MDFTAFKMSIIEATGLAKDALHIYVGIGAYFLCLMLLRPIFKKQGIRSFIALVIVTCIALLGEYLDNRETIESLGLAGLSRDQITASIRDLINTCLLSYVLYGLNKWTKIFHPTSKPASLTKRHKKTDY
ncbi:hypothetical protein [Psychrobacter fjordensis]|uniref:hypothetical protein n=1 Tax=Psychrobacter fjordensis TaxID=664424 RepID=UPI00191ABE68|nr:hypothetical protein [Psychrobacter fjordensis]